MKKILTAILLLVSIQVSLCQHIFKETFTKSERPSKENIRIAVSDDLGNEGYLPVCIIKGKTDGPVFTIVAGVHGFEYPPIVATQQLMQEIILKDSQAQSSLFPLPIEVLFTVVLRM